MFFILLLSGLSVFAEEQSVLTQQKDYVTCDPCKPTACEPATPQEKQDQSHVNRKTWDKSTWRKVSEQKKQIARCVFFNKSFSPDLDYLAPLINQMGQKASLSFFVSEKGGIWLILFGEEETVKELYAVFTEIANGQKNDNK
ncbi:MAG: hypothetical protein LBC02_01305 [Planctomycetaceae bacterium]|nr:hypothetical protein [Planctomycetaceae bacterium]